jgi:hypothetical protein
MALTRRTTKTDPSPSPEQPRIERIEDDGEYQAFDRRFTALTERKAAIVARQLKLEALHPRIEAPSRIDPELFERAAGDMLRAPPDPASAIPTTLRGILDERQLITRALELGHDEGRRVGMAAFDRLRAARAGEWADAVKQVALCARALEQAIAARDKLGVALLFGPMGRVGLPLSDFEVVVRRGQGQTGAHPLNELVTAALDADIITKKDIA